MNLIKLENISFAYEPEGDEVFKDFSFHADRGEAIILMGGNGSGKSTLFNLLNGLIFPQKGQYYFEDVLINREYMDNNAHSKLFHKKVGYLFQNPDVMLFNGRVYDEIAFGPRQMGLDDKEVERRTTDCLKLFGIEELAPKAPYHLSAGQKKKVAFASVISLNPEVLILDEPLAGLDAQTSQELVNFLTELKAAGKTIIAATHNADFAAAFGDRTVLLGS